MSKVLFYLLNSKKMSLEKQEYIWYCARPSCGSIICKTTKPILPEKKTHKCKRCNEKLTGLVLMRNNKKNIRKFVEHIESI